jgi:hypothetical protein
MILRALLLSILLAGCVPLPPTPQDLQAKEFLAVPDKAVIYLVRDYPDFNHLPATIWLGDNITVTTHPGTYYRWEVEPGKHRIAGFGVDSGFITLEVAAGRIYFVQQRLVPWMRYAMSSFHPLAEPQGRSIVMRGVMIGGR